ncbi:N-methyl-D-aspartate receptor NMDAR2C subunit [Uliginosibacterium sediminicola]|uniref:N-methyl-D-aspartate receptor NMDAR2C subunit n=1 Tax=Uliginosibacterium sediminicola TaxID=2024550 RepID=A0ABU9Z1A0_9RHOO
MVDLQKSWQIMWLSLGAKTESDRLLSMLLDAYSEPHRHYHTLQHLTECIDWLNQSRHLAASPAEIEAALWFHDAIYDCERHDNEERSAEWALSALLSAGVSAPTASRVADLVISTKHAEQPAAPDAQLLVDIDLAILGASPSRFEEYEQQIRAEYSFVPDATFKVKRLEILSALAARPCIYGSPFFQARLESQARENLQKVCRVCLESQNT